MARAADYLRRYREKGACFHRSRQKAADAWIKKMRESGEFTDDEIETLERLRGFVAKGAPAGNFRLACDAVKARLDEAKQRA